MFKEKYEPKKLIEPNMKQVPTKVMSIYFKQDVDWEKVLEQIIRDMGGNDEPVWSIYT